jgi:ABC-type multidrug transport system ATPase subunit
MKLYAAKKSIILMSDPVCLIQKGQLIAVEAIEDLPDFGFMYGEELNPEDACEQDWEELDLKAWLADEN